MLPLLEVTMIWILTILVGCNGSGIYETCEEPDSCAVPEDVTAACIDGGDGDAGFCTWECASDEDCNPGEDRYDWHFVCGSFEETSGLYCFPACDGAADPDEPECPPHFGCRSTGGGNENEKVCYPS
jgi:hypothetical protein